MKELLSKDFWRGVKQTFDDARDDSPTRSLSPASDEQHSTAATAIPASRDELRGILFDMDGVLYDADRLITGAAETVQWVLSAQIPHLFVTNTTSRTRSDLVQKLASFGIAAVESEILTPAVAAADWLRTNGKGNIAAFVRAPVLTEFADLPLLDENAERGADYVVIGDLGDLWDYQTLNRAFRLLHHNPEAKLIALGMTRYWLAADGISLDVAPFVVALGHASGRKATVFGKPSGSFFRAASERLNLQPGQLLMVGDDIDADVGGAQAAGLKGALVKTGKFRDADLGKEVRPQFVLDSIAELPQLWQGEPSEVSRPST